MGTKLLFAIAAAGASLIICPAVARAMTQHEVEVVPGQTTTASFPAIATKEAQVHFFGGYPSVADCRDATECDVVPAHVKLPSDWDPERDEAITHVTLTWDNPTRDDDLNLYSFDRYEHRSEQSVSDGDSEHVNAADDKFYLVVVNHSGVNTGYTLRFEWSRKHYSGSTDGTTSDGIQYGPIVVLKEPTHTTWTAVYGQGSADDPTNTILPSGTGPFEEGVGGSPVRTGHHAVGPPHTTSDGHVPLKLAIGGVTAMLIYGAGRIVRRTRARSNSLHGP